MRARTLTTALVVASLGIAACGDDANDTADTTTAEAESTEAAGTESTEAMTETTEAMADTTEAMSDETSAAADGDIVAVASSAGDFTTLVAAVEAAGLVETLQGPGPFTVFAPTDDAFVALPAGVLDALLLPENQETLTKILTYHVLPAEVLAADVAAGDVDTVEGQPITITTDGGVKVNDATVVTTDVMASNGVIHVIDAVLIPPDVDPATLVS